MKLIFFFSSSHGFIDILTSPKEIFIDDSFEFLCVNDLVTDS